MESRTGIALAPFTTFHIGGPASVYIRAVTQEEVGEAIEYARENSLPIFVLGAGSNVLVPDAGVDGVVLHMQYRDMHSQDKGMYVELVAGAGTMWDEMVDCASRGGLHGIENLAGIPGTVGGAVVQNIGAYGVELAASFVYADVIDSGTGEKRRITKDECQFGYRTSIFKHHKEWVIVAVALALPKDAPLSTSYADLGNAAMLGTPLSSPAEVARAVREIRAQKLPMGCDFSAGSFFKNPVISGAHAAELTARYADLPVFPQENGMVKVSLAWILDHVLALRGFTMGLVRLYEKQPLVMVAQSGARAADVDALARHVSTLVFNATAIMIEREVETFSVHTMEKNEKMITSKAIAS